MIADRSYWRDQPTSRLIDEARYSDHELAMVMGERLEDIEIAHAQEIDELKERITDFEIDANQLDDKVYELRAEIARMESIIDGMAAEIEQLKETSNVSH